MNVDSISEAYNEVHNAQVALSQRDHDHIIEAAMEALQRWSKARRAKDLVDAIGMQSEYDEGLSGNSSLAHVFFSKVKAEPQVCVQSYGWMRLHRIWMRIFNLPRYDCRESGKYTGFVAGSSCM